MTAYRDESAALKTHLDDLRRELEQRESALMESFWEAMPESTRERYLALRQRCAPASSSLASVAGAIEATERCFKFLAALSELESVWNTHPPLPPPPPPPPPLLVRWLTPNRVRLDDPWDEIAPLAERLHKLALRHDLGATSARGAERGTFEVRLSTDGVPVVLGVQITGHTTAYGSNVIPAVHAVTSVSHGAAPLALRPEGWSDELFKFAHLRREYTVGDPLFDGYFFIDADPAVAQVLLSTEVRTALLTIAREDVPVLEVAAGVAALRWRFEPTEASVDAALTVLRAIRAEPPTVPQRRR